MNDLNCLTISHQYFNYDGCPDLEITAADQHTQQYARKRKVFWKSNQVFYRKECKSITLNLQISSGDYYLYSDIDDFEHFDGDGIALDAGTPSPLVIDHRKAFSQQGGRLTCLITAEAGRDYHIYLQSRVCRWQYIVHADRQQFPNLEVGSNRLEGNLKPSHPSVVFDDGEQSAGVSVFTSDQALALNKRAGGLFKLTFSLGNAGRQDLADPLPNPGPSNIQASAQGNGFIAVQHVYL